MTDLDSLARTDRLLDDLGARARGADSGTDPVVSALASWARDIDPQPFTRTRSGRRRRIGRVVAGGALALTTLMGSSVAAAITDSDLGPLTDVGRVVVDWIPAGGDQPRVDAGERPAEPPVTDHDHGHDGDASPGGTSTTSGEGADPEASSTDGADDDAPAGQGQEAATAAATGGGATAAGADAERRAGSRSGPQAAAPGRSATTPGAAAPGAPEPGEQRAAAPSTPATGATSPESAAPPAQARPTEPGTSTAPGSPTPEAPDAPGTSLVRPQEPTAPPGDPEVTDQLLPGDGTASLTDVPSQRPGRAPGASLPPSAADQARDATSTSGRSGRTTP